MANGCFKGSAGFEEQAGARLRAGEDGTLSISRTFRGSAANLAAFLTANPEGDADSEFTDLDRTRAYDVTYAGGYAFCTLTYVGEADPGAVTTPVRITKRLVARTAHIAIEPGTTIPDDSSSTVLALKYTTMLHSVEYTLGSDSDSPQKESLADLPTDLEDAIAIVDTEPAVPLGATEYLGGEYNPPSGKTAVLSDSGGDYELFTQCVNYERVYEGSSWRFREDWAVLIQSTEP